jgi:hypothetical protein
MGWSGPIARAAVDAAAPHVSTDATIETLIREAPRRCMNRHSGATRRLGRLGS